MGIRIIDVGLACLVLYLLGRFIRRGTNPLPPGPHGLPLVGNLLEFLVHAPHKTWGAMSRKYGSIMSLRLMGAVYVVINSPKVAKDLLERESAITSNRPHLTMGGDLVGLSNFTVLLQYGDALRKHRKFFHQQIGTKSSLEVYYPAEEAEAKQLMRNLLKTPDGLMAHCHRMAVAVILQISHGYTVKAANDPFVEMADKVVGIIPMVMTPGRHLVDMLPILRHMPEWFPGCGFHEIARQLRKMVNGTVDTLQEFVLGHLAKGDAAPSFMSRALQGGVTPEEDILKWASFSMYLGGSETTPAILQAFFLAMTMYPEVLKKAQAEMDAVIGHDRLPTCKDRDALPYTNAICMEVLRWHPVGAFTMHITTQDTIYEGYLIPKGTHLLPNIWFMLSDPETYPNPDVFDPARFLGKDRQLDPREVCFGWGRRSCPGARQAELTIFTCVAMTVATLDISRCVESGVECVPKYDVTEGMARLVYQVVWCKTRLVGSFGNSRIKPFKCRITPRSKKAEDLL